MTEARIEREHARVTIHGVVTVTKAALCAETLRAAIALGEPITIDISGLEHADASVVQLLIAAATSAVAAHIPFSVEGDTGPLLVAMGGSPDLAPLLARV